MTLTRSVDTNTLEHIYPADLIASFNRYLDKIRVLSLDCFDTLLWRKTALPADVFYDLQHKPAFSELKLTPSLRIMLEAKARSLKVLTAKSTEVTLRDIYLAGYPDLSAKQLEALQEEELAAEITACYAFPPIIELMRVAQARQLKIIIVSNTYFTEKQLRRLLAKHLPADLLSAISEIYCSCEYGVSKNNGLFSHVLEKSQYVSTDILHIGDNQEADFEAAREKGLRSLRLLQHDAALTEFFRLHAAAATIFQPGIRYTQSLATPFRGILASKKIQNPEHIIGYASVGSIMYAFAEYILAERAELIASGKKPKIMFLMRDAYLPAKICDALHDEKIGKNIRISRFAAYAATFRTKEDILKYLSENVFSCRFRDISRQLLLPDEIIEPLIQVVMQSASPISEFIRHIQEEKIQNIIIHHSKQYRIRLINYLRKEMDIQPGDTLMFVDLGYAGTAQRLLEPLFREELNIEIIGRYLIALTTPDWHKSRRGLLDPSWCDERAMLALIQYIALLEQICTSNENSVVDYDDKGNPVFSTTSLSKNQHLKLDKIQHECVQFAKDAKNFFSHIGKPSINTLKEVTLAELSRLIFLPTEKELQYLESFQFDLNLGTTDILQVFNTAEGLTSLRKRGLFFSALEKNQKTMRTNYPAELRSAGLELVMTLMTQCRFGIELGFKDMSLRREKLDLVVTENDVSTNTTIEASLTYDGYYSVSLPICSAGFKINILVGKQYEWIEFHSAELIELNAFLNNKESIASIDYWPNLSFHEITHHNGKLYQCQSTSSSIGIHPPISDAGMQNYVVRIIFRPIVFRDNNLKQGC